MSGELEILGWRRVTPMWADDLTGRLEMLIWIWTDPRWTHYPVQWRFKGLVKQMGMGNTYLTILL